jgi:hypothetical protein
MRQQQQLRTSEKWLERAVGEFVTDGGGAAIKMLPVLTGLPDRLILWPGGIVEFVELKSTGKNITRKQRAVAEMLLRLGFRYTVIDNEIKLKQWQNLNHDHIKRK